ncbi:MAG TPA: hypothetical protein VLH75_19000 [Longimicrobiales bacterium]|nr:hypothetical protein [Longimicrobiales bacterium]
MGEAREMTLRRPGPWACALAALFAAGGCGSDPAAPEGEAPWVQVAAGGAHTCALDGAGRVACWGSNGSGQLGFGGERLSSSPRYLPVEGPWKAVTAGLRHTCALAEDGSVWCWGANDAGQLGDGGPRWGGPAQRSAPAPVPMLGRYVAVTAGEVHACALASGGEVVCWGSSEEGQSEGGGLRVPAVLPTLVPGGPWKAVTAGAFHTCALARDGTAACWGANGASQIGAGVAFADRMAVSPVGGGRRFLSLAAGVATACGVDESRRVLCWGDNTAGQVAATGARHGSPVLRWVGPAAAVGAGEAWVCAVALGGEVTCWGARWDRSGAFTPEVEPAGWEAPVSAPAQLSVGARHACAVTADGGVVCWGDASGGRLGPFAP